MKILFTIILIFFLFVGGVAVFILRRFKRLLSKIDANIHPMSNFQNQSQSYQNQSPNNTAQQNTQAIYQKGDIVVLKGEAKEKKQSN